jgi:hypothetical protein
MIAAPRARTIFAVAQADVRSIAEASSREDPDSNALG